MVEVEDEARMEDEEDASFSGSSVEVLLLAPAVLGAEDAEVLVVAMVEEPEEGEAELLLPFEDEPSSLLILMLCQLPDLSLYS